MTHWFSLILEDTRRIFELESDDDFDEAMYQIANDLFEAGCDDGTFGTSQCVLSVGFAREAETLEEAVRSAIANVQSTGIRVQRIVVEEPPEVESINAQLADGTLQLSQ
jgi:hypothetical protein